jgi:hypothetical protein
VIRRLTIMMMLLFARTLLPAPLLATEIGQSFFGNSFPGNVWIQNNAQALAIADDGKIYLNSHWDEAGREAGIYDKGHPVGMLQGLHGWGRHGGRGIALSGDHVFAAAQQEGGYKFPEEDYPPKGERWFGIRRFQIDGTPAPWIEGRGYDDSFLILSKKHPVTGMTVFRNKALASVGNENVIYVIDHEQMKIVEQWDVPAPGALAAWPDTIWVLPEDNGQPYELSPEGTPTGRRISGIEKASAVAATEDRLWIADNGPAQQIHVFDLDLNSVEYIGVKGGVYADTRGALGPLRFNGITALGIDPAGNLIVAENARGPHAFGFGLTLSAYSPENERLWSCYSYEFVTRGDIDPTNETDIYSRDRIYRRKNSIPRTGPAAEPVAITLDRFRYPNDPRLHSRLCSADLLRVNGQRLLAVNDQYAKQLNLFRFEGHIAIPTAIFSQSPGDGNFPPFAPTQSGFMWHDSNGDGNFQPGEFTAMSWPGGWAWHVGEKGDVWFASHHGEIRRWIVAGFNEHTIPAWAEQPDLLHIPTNYFTSVCRIEYEAATDTLYVGGYSDERPLPSGDWGLLGTRVARFDHFMEAPHVRWTVELDYDPPSVPHAQRRLPKAMDVEEGLLFVGYCRGAEIDVYDAADGRSLASLKPGPAVDSQSGWLDIPYAIRAHRLASGAAWLVIAEEVWKGKNILYWLEDPR